MVPESLPERRRSLGALLRIAYDALSHEVYGGMAEAGFADVRRAHASVFRHLSPQGARTVDLATRAGMRKQSMGALLEDLAALGYVETAPDPEDRRARIVRLTARGFGAQATLVRLSAEIEATWAARLGEAEWAIARRTLELLVDFLEPRPDEAQASSPSDALREIDDRKDHEDETENSTTDVHNATYDF